MSKLKDPIVCNNDSEEVAIKELKKLIVNNLWKQYVTFNIHANPKVNYSDYLEMIFNLLFGSKVGFDIIQNGFKRLISGEFEKETYEEASIGKSFLPTDLDEWSKELDEFSKAVKTN